MSLLVRIGLLVCLALLGVPPAAVRGEDRSASSDLEQLALLLQGSYLSRTQFELARQARHSGDPAKLDLVKRLLTNRITPREFEESLAGSAQKLWNPAWRVPAGEPLSAPPTDPTTPTLPPGMELIGRHPEGFWEATSRTDGGSMILIPAGEFLMGPRQPVTVAAFWLDRTEVTVARFEKFVQATGHVTDAERRGSARAWDEKRRDWAILRGAAWRHPRGPGTTAQADHPVVNVSMEDARAYCRWSGGRLPTEAEWEKGARGIDGRTYPWGSGMLWSEHANSADRHARDAGIGWAEGVIDDGFPFTAPVGRYPTGASPYGLLDMAGNVFEWCEDPGGTGSTRAVRGGAWSQAATFHRCASRYLEDPGRGFDDIGFRTARSAFVESR